MNNKLIASIIGVTICIILTGSVLAPVIQDNTTTHTTFSNVDDALGFVERIDETSTYLIMWDMANPETMTVNDVPISPYKGSIIMAWDSYCIRYGFDTGSGYYVQSAGSDQDFFFKTNWPATGSNVIKMTFNEGTLTVAVNDSVQRTYTYSEGYVLSEESDLVMKAPTQKAYVLKDTEIYANGRTPVNGQTKAIQISGTVESVDIDAFPASPAMTAKNIIIHAEKLGTYEAYQLESITFDVVNADESQSTACTYNYFVVPAEITAEKSGHLDNGSIAIIAAIPIIIIAAILVSAISVIRPRD